MTDNSVVCDRNSLYLRNKIKCKSSTVLILIFSYCIKQVKYYVTLHIDEMIIMLTYLQDDKPSSSSSLDNSQTLVINLVIDHDC
jgi:hypothetical protein